MVKPYYHKFRDDEVKTPDGLILEPDGAEVFFCARWYKIGLRGLVFFYDFNDKIWRKANDSDGKIKQKILSARKYGW